MIFKGCSIYTYITQLLIFLTDLSLGRFANRYLLWQQKCFFLFTLVFCNCARLVQAFARRKSPLKTAILFPNCISFSGPSQDLSSPIFTIPRCTRKAVWISSVISARLLWLKAEKKVQLFFMLWIKYRFLGGGKTNQPHVLNRYFMNHHVALLCTSRSHNPKVLSTENYHSVFPGKSQVPQVPFGGTLPFVWILSQNKAKQSIQSSWCFLFFVLSSRSLRDTDMKKMPSRKYWWEGTKDTSAGELQASWSEHRKNAAVNDCSNWS